MTEGFPILQTKLHRPPTPVNVVPRPALLERLERHRQRPLTLVSAPAGYGKTTLISGWLESIDVPAGWVSLDEHDDDPATFLSYFLAAVSGLFPKVIDDSLALLKAPELPPVRVLSSTLINDLTQIGEPFLLVLDDFHAIRHMDILDLVSDLLRYPPPNMHLVLILRKDPPLNMTELRALNRLTEIRIQDLRFSEAEVGDYLGMMQQEPLDSGTVKLLEEKSEGWVTGIRLLTLSMRQLDDADWVNIKHLANNRLVEDYLMSVILDLQEPTFVACLLRTAILDRFCAPLCDAVCGPQKDDGSPFEGESFISLLRSTNLFVIPLDTQQQWYRYHHLFQAILLRQLEQQYGKVYTTSLHGRASAWYADNNYIDEALRHCLSAGDLEGAVDLVAQHRHSLMNKEEWRRLDRWLSQFPEAAIEAYPDLLILQAWVQFYLWYDLAKTLELLDQVELLLQASALDTTKAKQITAEAAAIRSQFYYYYVDVPATIAATKQVMVDTPSEHECVWTSGFITMGGAYQLQGHKEKALRTLSKPLESKTLQSPGSNARLLFALCVVHWSEGDLRSLLQVAGQLLKYSDEHALPWSSSYARYYLGVASYERNELSAAADHLESIVLQPYHFPFTNVGQGALPLALVYLAQGQAAKAREVTQTLADLAFERQNSFFADMSKQISAELDVRDGQGRAAAEWAEGFSPGQLVALHRFTLPDLTYIKALMAEESPTSRAEVQNNLAQAIEHFRATHSKPGLIKTLALRAIHAAKQGEEPQALADLEQAVQLAEPGHWIRPFVDLGPGMIPLLNKLRMQDKSASFVTHMLEAFPSDGLAMTVYTLSHQTPHQGSVDALTARELEVLEHLARRMSNKEIATSLFISPATVRNHTHKIYQKLQVTNRQQAVSKALSLGLLTVSPH